MAKIMIIDDEETIIDFVRVALKAFGYEVMWASSGETALMMLQDEKPDLIFLDVMMPNMNGWEVLDLLKTDETLRVIPVVMLTALDDASNRLHSMKEGAASYLSKPFNHNQLLETISSILEDNGSSS